MRRLQARRATTSPLGLLLSYPQNGTRHGRASGQRRTTKRTCSKPMASRSKGLTLRSSDSPHLASKDGHCTNSENIVYQTMMTTMTCSPTTIATSSTNEDPSAPLVVGGLAPVVISGHRTGEEFENNTFDNIIAPVEPLAVGLAPLGSGHRTTDERPSRGAPATQCELTGEMRSEAINVTAAEDMLKIKPRSGSSRWGGDKKSVKFSRSPTPK